MCYNIVSAAIAQSVERIHGKDEVPGSNPGRGSIVKPLAYARGFTMLAVDRDNEVFARKLRYPGCLHSVFSTFPTYVL